MVSGLFRGNLDYGRIVHWKADRLKRILGTCPNRLIDPVNAARFMTAASTLQRLARSAALNASCAKGPSRIGTPPGCLDIGSSPVQLRVRMTTPNAPRDSNQIAKICRRAPLPEIPGLTSDLPRVGVGLTPDYGRKAGLKRVSTGAYSSDVRAATNFRGAEKSRVWLGGRYSMARWRNGSSQGFHYRA